MYSVEVYNSVRYAVMREGRSIRSVARDFGLDRRTVSKMLCHSVPPGYRRSKPPRRPKLDGFTDIIDQILHDDTKRPKKQRHTAKRIFERLQDEHHFTGGITIFSNYIREQKRRTKEVFVPLFHEPGHAQVDFGEALVIIGGVEMKAHYFAFDLPHSDAVFVKAYPRETTEAFCDGHVSAFAFFGGIPKSILYDNTKIAVARILGDGTRKRTQVFSELQSHYLFEDRFGRPAKGNDKGKVEGMIGYIRRNFFVPIPSFDTFDDLNVCLEEQCLKRQEQQLRGHKQTIEEQLMSDLDSLMSLPTSPYDACEKIATTATSISTVRYRSNDYSVPVRYAHADVNVKGYVHEVIIASGTQTIACHPRSYEREDMVFDPIHYLPLLEQKVGAFDQAAPLKGWDLPDEFKAIQRLLVARQGKKGKREYIQILRLLENFDLHYLHAAIKAALHLGAVSYDAIKHLVLCQVERRPPKLDLDIYPYLPRTNIKTTKAASYMALLQGADKTTEADREMAVSA